MLYKKQKLIVVSHSRNTTASADLNNKEFDKINYSVNIVFTTFNRSLRGKIIFTMFANYFITHYGLRKKNTLMRR